jgi:hypothetical protein
MQIDLSVGGIAPIGCGFPERDRVCEAPLGLLAVRGFLH